MYDKTKSTPAQVEEQDIAASEKFARESEELIKPLFVYESLDQLPEEIRIRPAREDGVGDQLKRGLTKITFEEDDQKDLDEADRIYAVLQNHDITEGRGPVSVWLLASNLPLTVAVARGNGVSGSACEIASISLNKYPIEKFMKSINLDTRKPM